MLNNNVVEIHAATLGLSNASDAGTRCGWSSTQPRSVRWLALWLFSGTAPAISASMDSQGTSQPKASRGAGGTPGGIGMFFFGVALACAGGWLLTNQVTVTSQFFASSFLVPVINYHMNTFGLTLVPFVIGVAFLFYNGKSVIGWVLTVGSLAAIIAGILMSLHIYFQPTSLFNTLVMLVLLFGGLGLIFRSLKAFPAQEAEAPKQ